MLRRSPATGEHQDRHHAVVLTELPIGASAGSEFGVRHRAVRVSRTRRCRSNGAWIGWIGKTYDYFLYVASTLPLRSTRVRRQHSPLVAMHLLDRSCVIVGIFLKYCISQQWYQSQVLCVDVICTSRTQVSCGRYKSYCLPACHTLVQRYCWMKRPGPTLRVRLRETGSTDVLCTQVAGGCQFLQL